MAYEIIQENVHRTERVGACPVLRVQVSFPRLDDAEDGEGVRRFNQTYREAAEKFIAWATDTLSPLARTEFEMEGTGAAYRFARREASCFITARPLRDAEVEVTTLVSWGCKGDGEPRKTVAFAELWRFPQGWIEIKGKSEVSQIAKIKKNARNLLKKCRKCGTIIESVP